MKTTKKPRRTRGFTLVELLITLVVLSVIGMLAYPSLRTFSARNNDADVATNTAHRFNKVRDQARRRNRAYVVQLTNFNGAQPLGLMQVRESNGPSCHDVAANVNANSRRIAAFAFGETPPPIQNGNDMQVETRVGLLSWSADGVAGAQNAPLTLCVAPDGSTSRVVGAAVTPLNGRLSVRVQAFDTAADGFTRFGPPRQVDFTFAGGAQLALN